MDTEAGLRQISALGLEESSWSALGGTACHLTVGDDIHFSGPRASSMYNGRAVERTANGLFL